MGEGSTLPPFFIINELMRKKYYKELLKEKQELLTEEYFKRVKTYSEISLRELIVKVLLTTFCVVVFSTVIIIFLQGFRFSEFNLPIEFLKWLGGATLGEVVGLVALICHQLFKIKA
jgi:hypothetical protein